MGVAYTPVDSWRMQDGVAYTPVDRADGPRKSPAILAVASTGSTALHPSHKPQPHFSAPADRSRLRVYMWRPGAPPASNRWHIMVPREMP